MLHLMPVVVVAGLAMGAVGIGAWMMRQNRRCPECDTPMDLVAAPDGLHTYEVLACPSCPTAITLSHGSRRRFQT